MTWLETPLRVEHEARMEVMTPNHVSTLETQRRHRERRHEKPQRGGDSGETIPAQQRGWVTSNQVNTPPNDRNDHSRININININNNDDSGDIDINDYNDNGNIDINDNDNGYNGYGGKMEGLDSYHN